MTTYSFGSSTALGYTATTFDLPSLSTFTAGGDDRPFLNTNFVPGNNPGELIRVRITFDATSTYTMRIHQPAGGSVIIAPNGGPTPLSSPLAPTQDLAGNGNTTVYLYGTPAEIQAVFKSLEILEPDNSTNTDVVRFAFQYYNNDGGSYNAVGLGSSLSAVTFTACYLRGTMIRMAEGERAVEQLQIGDMVLTADGVAKPVKWIGYRFYEVETVTPALVPVLLRAGAIAAGIPSRDLRVSPMHGILVDDVIVPAVALVNGDTILRDTVTDGIDYFHVELDGHDLIIAEGCVAETFVDEDSRAMFENVAEYTERYGSAVSARLTTAPRVEEGYLLEAIQRRLAAGASADACSAVLRGMVERISNGVLEGWATDDAAPVELDVLVDGEVVSRLVANRYRTDLDDAGIAGGRAGFTVALPASALSLDQVSVRRVSDSATLPVLAAETADA